MENHSITVAAGLQTKSICRVIRREKISNLRSHRQTTNANVYFIERSDWILVMATGDFPMQQKGLKKIRSNSNIIDSFSVLVSVRQLLGEYSANIIPVYFGSTHHHFSFLECDRQRAS